jgi:hypothetical protein
MERRRSGRWQVLGTAALDKDFSGQIEALRFEALVRGPGPVDLWLPPDQLFVRRYELRRGARDRAEALRRLSAETGRRPDELCIALCPAPAGAPVTVVGVLASTVAEARDYAGRWGFRPGRVSFSPDAAPFGATIPDFGQNGWVFPSPALPAGGRGLAATAAAAVVLLGFAGWGVWELTPGDEPPLIVSDAPVLGLARVEAAAPDPAGAPVTKVRRGGAQSMPAQPAGPGQRAAPVLAGPAAPAAHGMAAELAQPSPGVRMRVGPGPGLPQRSRPARLDSAVAVTDRLDPVALVSAMDRLRDETALRAAAGPLTMAAVTVLAPEQAPRPAGDPESAAEAEGSGSPDTADLAALSAAPRAVPDAPPPRPEPEADAGEPEGEGDTAAPEPEADAGEPVSALAALAAPSPPVKPEEKARRVASAAALRAYGGDPSPSSVQLAASERGLDLDSTSLIGVLDAKSGRQALLRTSAGEFVKVARGDSVNGWRVSAINRETIRLTRGGQSRTLLLMVR